jgi:DNA (cytosine-5)-methyltransferase 1
MGFDDEDYKKASSVVSDSQIYKQAGNSIIVDVIYAVFKELFKAMPYLFTDMKLLHLFSGIGSVEKGIKRVVDEANALALKGGDLVG